MWELDYETTITCVGLTMKHTAFKVPMCFFHQCNHKVLTVNIHLHFYIEGALNIPMLLCLDDYIGWSALLTM